MGAVASRSQTRPAGSNGETTADTVDSMDIARQQEIQSWKDYYEDQIRILQALHKKEKRYLSQENQKLKKDIRVHKMINTKLRKNNTAMMELEADLQTELQEAKFTIRKLQEDKDTEIIETSHRREKRSLMEKIKELRCFVRSLKMTNNNLHKDIEERVKIENQLQEDLQKLRVMNNKLGKKCETVMRSEVNLRTELERVKFANENLNEYWESKIKEYEDEKKILVIRNQELQKELEAKINVRVENFPFVGCSSQPQQVLLPGIDTGDGGKVTLDNFEYIKDLGAGGFGKVFLAKGKILGGPEQSYAVKTLKKRKITSSKICDIMTEKQALMLTSGHPFITTLYSCFQNKENLFFVMEYMSGGDLKRQLDEVEVFSEKRTKFYAAEIALAVQFLHQNGILHRDLKLENVLVGSDGHCKIADFGISKLGLFHQCKVRSQCGTPFYMAPEIVKGWPYGQGVDWWAVGVMIFEMLTGYPPFDYDEEDTFDDSSLDQLDQKILNDEVDYPNDMSLAAISIVTKLLTKNPEQRLGSDGSFERVRQQPFFKGIDWQALHEKRVEPPEKETAAKNSEDDRQGFNKVLKDDNTPCTINQNLFEGFSFINYGVK